VRHSHAVFVDAFSFLAETATARIPKLTIPGPGVCTLMGGRAVVDETTYPDMELFWDDLVAAYRAEIDLLYQAGCRYLQLDDGRSARHHPHVSRQLPQPLGRERRLRTHR
jgi:5-methyltetrahydropteroyltriglutamate--homocysteine methyltransferase